MNAHPRPVPPYSRRSNSWISTLAALAAAGSSVASAGIWYDETNLGDLSNDYANPTPGGSLSYGDNILSGATGTLDRDYITFTIDPGMRLVSMTLETYISDEDRSFIGLSEGAESIDPLTAATHVGELLGYALMGNANTTALLGTDILDDLAAAPDVKGFNIPLGPGEYTIWIQEGATSEVTYSLNLSTVPEAASPATAVGFFLAGVAIQRRSRRKS